MALKRLAMVGGPSSYNATGDPHRRRDDLGDRLRCAARADAQIFKAEAGRWLTLDGTDIVDPAAVIYNYAAAAAEAGYLFGLVVGTATKWETVQAIAPPFVPAEKGGAR